ncbi:hypothetical protein [uncultured Campylobacter sp.]|uniref:hypothetical protein n=1 Tax=uncultured Campylobacter sp. TaxID=218934 RepID=UPI00261137AD|nr:hypothetical protein [uncultured Campylobacter sp.]
MDKFKAGAALRKKETRDYDKEPLVLRDYSGFALILHYLIILIFWITASGFCISYLDDFESGILDFDDIKRTIIKFGFAIVVFLIFDCFNIINSKKKYTYFYNSKVTYYDQNFKETSSEDIIFNNKTAFKAVWFLDMIISATFGKIFLVSFFIISFIKGTFGISLIGVLLLIFILLFVEFLEIIVFLIIYRHENKSFKNFWKIFPKFQINLEYIEETHWSDYRWKNQGLYSIHIFSFNEENYNKVRDYIFTVFNIDINKNLSK